MAPVVTNYFNRRIVFLIETFFMKLIFILLAFIPTLCSYANNVTGTVTDDENKPVQKATITLMNVNDSVKIKTTVADEDGKYRFENIAAGTYYITVTAIGYQEKSTAHITVNGDKDISVTPIKISRVSQSLSGVTVTAKRPPVEVKAGKTVVNVDASPTNAGLNVLEILEKSPGVTVDADGNISLKGKGGVLVLIDGKQTYLSGTQLAAFLKSIQASGLDQIEIMTNPPAKYDAAGNSGIINIKTKKGQIRGMNGSVNFNYIQGLYPKFFGGANFNYRNDKINVFGNYDGGQWEGWGVLDIDRNFYKNGVRTGSSDQLTRRHNKSNWHNAKLGFDYTFSKKDVAGIVVNTNFNPWRNNQRSASNLRDANGAITDVFISDANNSNSANNITTNLNYKHTFDSAGRELTIDLDQGYYKSKGYNLLTTKVLGNNNLQKGSTILLEGTLPSTINIYTAKVDYVHPFTKNTKLETGVKTSFVNTDNNVIYKRDTSTGWYVDEARTNHFIYKENVNAAYAIFSTSIKKWEFTGGLRMENTIATGTQVKTDSSFKRNYTNLFPNLGAVYNINDKNQLSLAYSRRIRRPDYDDLNPFIFFLDSLTYGQGNPYLRPQFANNIELSHTWNRFLTTTINYTQTNDIITELLKQNTEAKTTFQTKENFAKMKQWGLAISANKKIIKWWNLNLYTNVFHNTFSGLYNDGKQNIPVTIEVKGINANLTNSITLSDTWTAELSGWFSSNPSEGLIIGRPMGAANFALAKQILKKNGTIKVGVRDVFRTSNFSGYSRYADVDLEIYNDRRKDNPQFNIAFTYKFGKNNIAPARRRTGGAGDEQNRVKSGGN